MDYEAHEQEAKKKAAIRDKKKRKRMKMTGKSIFTLQRLMKKTVGKRMKKIKKKKKE